MGLGKLSVYSVSRATFTAMSAMARIASRDSFIAPPSTCEMSSSPSTRCARCSALRRITLPACAAWVIQALGALLRYAQIPSVREMSVRPIQATEGPAQQCVIVVPVFRHEATLSGLKWLLACLNDPPETPQHTEERFFEFQQSLPPKNTPE